MIPRMFHKIPGVRFLLVFCSYSRILLFLVRVRVDTGGTRIRRADKVSSMLGAAEDSRHTNTYILKTECDVVRQIVYLSVRQRISYLVFTKFEHYYWFVKTFLENKQ